jgi:diguanylate cyclase (GGDEF)-like protein
MFYYTVLAAVRRNATDGLYALFILGNILYNGTALLVFNELFGLHWFYLISFPILLSNGVYILFVLRLLDITPKGNPRLYKLGLALLGLFAAFVLLAMLKPNWSLEIDRVGVALFLGYGLLSGIVRKRQGQFSASMYLAAVLVFFALGALAISIGKMTGLNTLYVEHLGLLSVSLEALLLALVLAKQFSQLRLQFERERVHATHDMLTGLKNRRGFVEAGNFEIERSKRYGRPLSVIYLDLDNFKQLNDMRGHDVGDAALTAIAHSLRSTLRTNDLLARLGGDEFAMLLPEIGAEAALEVGDKIRIAVNNALREFSPVTASIGVIRLAKVTWTLDAIMKVADELMYEVKKSGKNNLSFRHYD